MQVNISLPDKLYQKARRTAQLNKKTVDEYVTELVANAVDESELGIPLTEDAALAREAEAWESLHPNLIEKYVSQHVAIYNGELIDVDSDPLALHRRVRKNYPGKTVWMSKVEEQPFQDINMRSPRLDRQ